MITRTGQHALRAIVLLAQHPEDCPMTSSRIAHLTGIPSGYLSKILGVLVRAGLLEATRGKGGGFRMTSNAMSARLLQVLSPFEPVLAQPRPCPFRPADCNDYDPCHGHERWRIVRECFQEFLQSTSILEVAGMTPHTAGIQVHRGI